ncbi:hypothetical protein ACFQX6_56890 [Streptosporangium lutulentum]
MQYLDDRLYIVTTDGTLACIDATEEAIRAAQAGTVPEVMDVKAAAGLSVVEPTTVLETVVLETVSGADGGVVVECFREGSGFGCGSSARATTRCGTCSSPRGARGRSPVSRRGRPLLRAGRLLPRVRGHPAPAVTAFASSARGGEEGDPA